MKIKSILSLTSVICLIINNILNKYNIDNKHKFLNMKTLHSYERESKGNKKTGLTPVLLYINDLWWGLLLPAKFIQNV